MLNKHVKYTLIFLLSLGIFLPIILLSEHLSNKIIANETIVAHDVGLDIFCDYFIEKGVSVEDINNFINSELHDISFILNKYNISYQELQSAITKTGFEYIGDSVSNWFKEKTNDIASQMIDGTSIYAMTTWQQAADLISTTLLDDFKPNITTFYTWFGLDKTVIIPNQLPALEDLTSPLPTQDFTTVESDGANSEWIVIFKLAGFVIATLIFLWHILAMMFGPLTDEKDGPAKLTVKYSLVIIAIYLSNDIMNIFLGITLSFWDIIMNFTLTDSSNLDNVLNGSEALYEALGKESSLLIILLSIGIGFIIAKNFLRLFVEIIERYFVAMMLYICFPLGVSSAVSSTTGNIFKSYLRMIFSQMFLLIMNLWFVRMFFNLLNFNAPGGITNIVYLISIIAFLRLAQRLDSYMASLGLNVAQTGGGLLDSLSGSMMVMGSMWAATKGASRLGGKALESAGTSTGNAAMFGAGQLFKAMGGEKNAQMVSPAGAKSALLNAQIAKGKLPNMQMDSGLWNNCSRGMCKGASALSSDSLAKGINGFMSSDFNAKNKDLSSVTAASGGATFKGKTTVGKTSDGKNIDSGFVLSRDASMGGTACADINGNEWFMKYTDNPSLSTGDSIASTSAQFGNIVGYDLDSLQQLNPMFNPDTCSMAEKTNDGYVLKDDNNNILGKVRDTGEMYWNMDTSTTPTDFTSGVYNGVSMNNSATTTDFTGGGYSGYDMDNSATTTDFTSGGYSEYGMDNSATTTDFTSGVYKELGIVGEVVITDKNNYGFNVSGVTSSGEEVNYHSYNLAENDATKFSNQKIYNGGRSRLSLAFEKYKKNK